MGHYRRFRYSRAYESNSPSEPPTLKLSSLALDDLKKLHRSLMRYSTQTEAARQSNKEIAAYNDELEKRAAIERAAQERARDEFIEKYLAPLRAELQGLFAQLRECQVQGLSGIFAEKFSYQFGTTTLSLRPYPGIQLAERHRSVYQRLSETEERCPRVDWSRKPVEKKKEVRPPPTIISMIIGGARIKVDLDSIRDEELAQCIQKRQMEAEERKLSLHEYKARAAQKESNVRELARPFKADQAKQLKLLDVCPYCAARFGDEDAHLDHIYPVSKGGLSVPKNLVFVCAPCNRKKKNHTLRHFIEVSALDERLVHEHLKLLRKDF